MDIDDVSFKPEHLAKLIEMIKNNEINRSVGKEVFEKVFKEDIDPAAYVEEHGLKSMNDEGALKATIEEIVANNPKSVEDYKAGKKKAIGFLVGQTMKATQGKANPGIVNKILTEIICNHSIPRGLKVLENCIVVKKILLSREDRSVFF